VKRVRAFAVIFGIVAAHLALQVSPAQACSCRADVQVADALAASDAAFVGVFTGRDDPLVHGEIISSARPVLNHFEVERVVKGPIGERVDVEAAASGASCGLEVEVGEQAGVLLTWTGTGWRSSLCNQTEAAELMAFAPAAAPAAPAAAPGRNAAPAESEPSERGFFVAVGLLVLAVPVFFGVQRWRRRGA
jgi:hypothetical protein